MDVKKTFFLTGNESFRAKNDLNRENFTIFKQQEREICDFDGENEVSTWKICSLISNDILQVFESIFQVQEIVMSVLFDYGFLLWLQTVIQTSSVFITICFFQNDLCFILEGEGECLMILTSIIDL